MVGLHLKTAYAAGALCALLALPRVGSAQAGPSDADMPPHPAPNFPGVVVLFGGKQEDVAAHWTQRDPNKPATWQVNEEGAMVTRDADIMSKERFTDFQLHVEFKVPYMPQAHGQARGNSGVFLQGRYEIQVLDSYGKPEPGKGDCGAVYNQAAALVNACKPPLKWQSYDIIFRAPRVDDTGKVIEKARVSVFLNGIAIQNNTEINGPTGAPIDNEAGKPGPIILQYHGNKVEYRNVWVLPLPPKGSDKYE
jgi:hypothetical protein